MVGYVLAGTPQSVVDGINAYLIGRSRPQETLSPSPIGVAYVFLESEHPRVGGGRPIELQHTLLTFV